VIVSVLAATGVAFSLSACSVIEQIFPAQAQRDAETQEVSEAGDADAFSLIVGDCFNEEAAASETDTEVSSVPAVPCEVMHDFEVFHAFDLTDENYPGVDPISEQADAGCEAAFDTFIGTSYLDSALGYGYLYPSESSWQDGDREIVCYVYGAEQNTGSLAGSGL
jgi:hypothetical protein